jgi:hypothetical protein
MWRLHFARENWGREQAHHNDDERNEVAADNAAVIGVRARGLHSRRITNAARLLEQEMPRGA